MNLVFTAFFAFEFVVKFAAFGLREYVKDPWNNFDFIIVIGSFLDIIMAQVCFSQLTALPAQISASNFHDLTQITQRRVCFNPKRTEKPKAHGFWCCASCDFKFFRALWAKSQITPLRRVMFAL